MASPHAAGVAALAVSAHGRKDAHGRGLHPGTPASVAALLASTATDHACPAGGVQSYTQEGRSAEFTATCVGTPAVQRLLRRGHRERAGSRPVGLDS